MVYFEQMPQERVIQMPPNDYALFQKLQAEVGEITSPSVLEIQYEEQWHNPDLESSEMAVRAMVRNAILERLGYKGEAQISEEKGTTQTTSVNSEAIGVLGNPNYIHYKWQEVSVKNFGTFVAMDVGNGPLVSAEKGIVFFADEVQKLLKGEPVITFHSSGFQQMGFLAERKDVYKVINGDLQRVRGLIID